MTRKSLVCLGNPPIAGCGRILTDEEREYYDCACEDCERAKDDAISEWRRGGDNPDLDRMFDDGTTVQKPN